MKRCHHMTAQTGCVACYEYAGEGVRLMLGQETRRAWLKARREERAK